MIEKLQNCARQWHEAVASNGKRDKMRAVTIKMRDHSLANEPELANAARQELEQLRATKIGEFDPKLFINDTSTLEDIKQAIQVCADMIAEAVSCSLRYNYPSGHHGVQGSFSCQVSESDHR